MIYLDRDLFQITKSAFLQLKFFFFCLTIFALIFDRAWPGFWLPRQDAHCAASLKFRWGTSHTNRTLLGCLGVVSGNMASSFNSIQIRFLRVSKFYFFLFYFHTRSPGRTLIQDTQEPHTRPKHTHTGLSINSVQVC